MFLLNTTMRRRRFKPKSSRPKRGHKVGTLLGNVPDPTKKDHVIICHYDHGGAPHTISININALGGHQNHVTDTDGPCPGGDGCGPGETRDCAGVCGGPSVYDCAQVCFNPETEDPPHIRDCAGECYPRGEDPPNIPDCAGQCGGDAVPDCAGECGGDAVLDCAGECGGNHIRDCAGECYPEGETPPNFPDCEGVCGGDAVPDCAGECGGDATIDCAGECGGDHFEDCGGNCISPCDSEGQTHFKTKNSFLRRFRR